MLNNKPTIRFLEPKAVNNSQGFKNDLHLNSSKKKLSARDILIKPSSKSSKVSPEQTIFSRNPSEGNIPAIENPHKKKVSTRSLTKLPSNKKKVFTPIISPNFQPKISHRRIHSDFLSNVYKSKITTEIKTLEKEISDKKLAKKKTFNLHARNNSEPFNTHSPYLSQEDCEKLGLIKYISQYFSQFNECPATTIEFYRPIGLIGKGAFGKVLHCEHKLTGKKVAIKAISKAQLQDQRSQKKVFQEVYILRKIKSKFVIRILEVFESDKNFLMVLEYAGGGDLLHYVREKGKLKEEEAKKIFKQIVQGAISIHEAGILHRDFKLDNILLDSRYSIIKICDFGVSKIIKEGEIITDQCGTPAYLAPEIIKNQGYQGFHVDIWSIGIVLYTMLCGKIPFKASNINDLHSLILSGTFEIPNDLSDYAKNLLTRMIVVEPTNRITLEEILKHPWFLVKNSKIVDKSHPQFFPKILKENSGEEIKQSALNTLVELGFSYDFLVKSLKNNEMNHATASYYLMT